MLEAKVQDPGTGMFGFSRGHTPCLVCRWPPLPLSSHGSLPWAHPGVSHCVRMPSFSKDGLVGLGPTLEASQVAQTGKNLPAKQETQVQFLGLQDSLEKGMATHFSTLAWKISWRKEPSRLQSMGWPRVRHDWAINSSLSFTSGLTVT